MPRPNRILPALAIALLALGALADGGSPSPDPESSLSKAESEIRAKQWRNAMLLLRKAEREEPNNPDVYNWEGYVARQRGDLDDAFRYYATALRLDPRHRGAHEYIGEAYVLAGKPDKAREHLTQLEAICGRTCDEYRDLAAAIEGRGKR